MESKTPRKKNVFMAARITVVHKDGTAIALVVAFGVLSQGKAYLYWICETALSRAVTPEGTLRPPLPTGAMARQDGRVRRLDVLVSLDQCFPRFATVIQTATLVREMSIASGYRL
jgi:hypothetical protein